jgi:hypothetical protein
VADEPEMVVWSSCDLALGIQNLVGLLDVLEKVRTKASVVLLDIG